MRFLLLFVAAFAFALTGCDSTSSSSHCYDCGSDDNGKDHGKDDGGSDNGSDNGSDGGGTTSDVFFDVDPRQTYLRTEQDGAVDAVGIALSDYGFKAGDAFCATAVGDYLLQPGQLASERGGSWVTAVFSADNKLEASTQRVRLHTAIEAGDDVVTPHTFYGQLDTDVSQDWDATSGCVTVPDGANYLFFAAYDSYYGDNAAAPGSTQPFGVVVKR